MMLCGYAPFEGDNNKEVFKKILSQDLEFDPEYWTTISEGAKDLITKMLKKDPQERISVNYLNRYGSLKLVQRKA